MNLSAMSLTASCFIIASLARAQVPPAAGRPVSPENRALLQTAAAPLDPDLAFPPVKPAIHGRSEWLKAAFGCGHLSPEDVSDSDIDDDPAVRVRIAVHHTEMPVTAAERGLGAAQAEKRAKTLLCEIRNAHMSSGNSDGVPWSDIGYHYLIDWNGGIWQGRKIDKQGANVSGMNEGTIGVALMGNFEAQHPAPLQLEALKKLLAYLVYSRHISPMAIHGHHEYVATACPGRYLERYQEYLEPYVAAKASPLRRIRMALIPLWDRMEAAGLVAGAPSSAAADSMALARFPARW